MKMRYIISVLLALLITAGFVGAVSATDIESISISIADPSVGGIPNSISNVTKPSNANITSIYWSPSDAKFQPEGEYTVTVDLKADEGYNFTSSTTATIGGVNGDILSNTNSTLKVKRTYIQLDSVDVASEILISITEPETGKTKSNPYTSSAGVSNSTITVSWSPTISSKFEPNTEYTATFTIKPIPGYQIPKSAPTVKINSKDAQVKKSGQTLTATYKFSKTDNLTLSKINLTLTPPVSDTSILRSASFDTDSGINSATVAWSPSVSSAYEVNKEYTASINVKTKDGYLLGPSTIVNLNGNKISSVNITEKTNTEWLVNYTFPTTTSNTISEITITGLTAPAYGATPVTKSSLSSSTGTTVKSVTWTPTVSSTFASNTAYTVEIIVETSSSSYKFSSTKPTVKIGTTTVLSSSVTRNSDTNVSFTYTFSNTTTLTLPTITFTANQYTGTIPLDVTFTYSVNDSTSRSITYGDTTSSTSLQSTNGTLKHTYSTAGTYTAKISATNANGTVTKEITIKPKAGLLNAFFTYTPSTGRVPLTVSFTDKSEGTISSRSWDFGGYGTSSEKNPSFEFKVPGVHKIILTIKDSSGNIDTYTETIVIQAANIATAQIDPKTDTSSAEVTNTSLPNLNPINIVQEFVKLFMALFNFDNYLIFQAPAEEAQG